MHDGFADWYRSTLPGTDSSLQPDLVERRWKGVEAAAESLPEGGELGLIGVLFSIGRVDNELESTLRTSFKSADSAFPMSGNAFEMQILAGAVALH